MIYKVGIAKGIEADIYLNLLGSTIADSIKKPKFLSCDHSIVQSLYCPTIHSLFYVNYQSYSF